MIYGGARFRKDHNGQDPKENENKKLYYWLIDMRKAKKKLETGIEVSNHTITLVRLRNTHRWIRHRIVYKYV